MKTKFQTLTSLCAVALLATSLNAFEPKKPTCIAPAKPGGGFDLTCRLISNTLQQTHLIKKPMLVSFMPGGVGAVAMNYVLGNRPEDPNSIIAASSGSALNIVSGKFGKKAKIDSVRWVGALATDYGALMVRADSKYKNLADLMKDLKADPKSVTFGSGGSVGSQDWFKAALIAKEAGIKPYDMKYVALEGGGEALTSLLGGHIQVAAGDAAEVVPQLESGKFRVLAVLSEERLEGVLNSVPTAIEQGFHVTWPTWRGFYVGPKVSDEEYNFWVNLFEKIVKTDEFKKERELKGLFPFTKIGKEFEEYMKNEGVKFTKLARDMGLIK